MQASDDLSEAFSLFFLLETHIVDSTNTETVEESATSRAGTSAIENAEEHAGVSDEKVAEGSATLKAHVEPESVSCTPVRNQRLQVQLSPFVNLTRGSSSRRSHSKWFIF
jgi:hypothetical protein